MRRNKTYSYMYLILWVIPLMFFVKDFFHLEEIRSLSFYENFQLFKISLTQGILSVIFSTIIAIIPAYYMS